MALGTLVAVIDTAGGDKQEFDDWYDREHIPERMALPGFLTANRWRGGWLSGPGDKIEDIEGTNLSLALYDLTSPEILRQPEYQALAGSPRSKRIIGQCASFDRYVAEQLAPGDMLSPDNAAALFMVAMNVEQAAEEEFNRWYREEHLPALSKVPGVLAARRFRSLPDAGRQRYFAIYHVESPEVLGGAAWREAGETPWTHTMRTHMRNRERAIYLPYQPVAEEG